MWWASATMFSMMWAAGSTLFIRPTPSPAGRHISSKSPVVSTVGIIAENFGIV
jgi:hypothetical protein